jgi:hypothetical protein
MAKIVERWVLFKYVDGEITPRSKPFKTKEQAEWARLKLPERERRIGSGGNRDAVVVGLYNFRQTRLPQKDIFVLTTVIFTTLACDTLDLTVDNVAGPPHFDFTGFLGTSMSALYSSDRLRISSMSAAYSSVSGFVSSSFFHN